MVVQLTVVVMHVRRTDAVLHEAKLAFDAAAEMGVARVKAEVQGQVGGPHKQLQTLGSREGVGNILDKHFHSELLSENDQFIQAVEGCLDLAVVVLFLRNADVLNGVLERNGVGELDGSLDLVRCGDTLRLGSPGHRYAGVWAALPPDVVAEQRRVDRMHLQFSVAKPVFQLFNLRAIVIVEVLPGAENLDFVHTASQDAVEQRHR